MNYLTWYLLIGFCLAMFFMGLISASEETELDFPKFTTNEKRVLIPLIIFAYPLLVVSLIFFGLGNAFIKAIS